MRSELARGGIRGTDEQGQKKSFSLSFSPSVSSPSLYLLSTWNVWEHQIKISHHIFDFQQETWSGNYATISWHNCSVVIKLSLYFIKGKNNLSLAWCEAGPLYHVVSASEKDISMKPRVNDREKDVDKVLNVNCLVCVERLQIQKAMKHFFGYGLLWIFQNRSQRSLNVHETKRERQI